MAPLDNPSAADPFQHPIDAHALAASVHRYIPSQSSYISLPPGVDPATVDFRTFYPYNPSEVKHRKRTTRSQLKVLEETFKNETKPNSTLRKALAAELSMTPRGVQVWFQNRRAKQKGLAKKAQSGHSSNSDRGNDAENSSPSEDVEDASFDADGASRSCPFESSETELSAGAQTPQQDTDSMGLDSTASRAGSYAVAVLDDPAVPKTEPTSSFVGAGISRASCAVHSRPSFYNDAILSSRSSSISLLAADEGSILNVRRPSLPTHIGSGIVAGPTQSVLGSAPPSAYPSVRDTDSATDTYDPLARRSSIDRLAVHPFAHVAVAANGAIFGSNTFAPHALAPAHVSGGRQSLSPNASYNIRPNPLEGRRPDLMHRASLPHVGSGGDVMSPPSAYRRRFPKEGHVFAVSARQYPAPVPGPLPSPDYSFGAPSVSQSNQATTPSLSNPTADNETFNDLSHFSFPLREGGARIAENFGREVEEESIFSSVPSFRFSSIASMASSETSATSACYSEQSEFDPSNAEIDFCGGPTGRTSTSHSISSMPYGFPERKSSSTSLLRDKFSGLDVRRASYASSQSTSQLPKFGAENTGLRSSPEEDGSPTNAYPSPSSTISGGNSRDQIQRDDIDIGPQSGSNEGLLREKSRPSLSQNTSDFASALHNGMDTQRYHMDYSRRNVQQHDTVMASDGTTKTSSHGNQPVQMRTIHSNNDVSDPTTYVSPNLRSSHSDSALPLTYPVSASSSTDYSYGMPPHAEHAWQYAPQSSHREQPHSHTRAYTELDELNLAFEPIEMVSETGHYSPVADSRPSIFDMLDSEMPQQAYQTPYDQGNQQHTSFSAFGESSGGNEYVKLHDAMNYTIDPTVYNSDVNMGTGSGPSVDLNLAQQPRYYP